MLKTIIVLPDGTELISGVGTVNAIKSVSITERVNSGTELTLGSACANMVEATIISPEGALSIAAGDEITVYQVDDSGDRYSIGIFITEKPTRSSANILKLVAYDRVSRLDTDLTDWLSGLVDWPYSLYKLAWMVCAQCGLELENTELPNGDFQVQTFCAQGITGRQLMQWIGEAAGRFCRATPGGKIQFDWYTPVEGHSVGPCERKIAEDLDVTYSEGDIAITLEEAEITETEDGLIVNSPFINAFDDGKGNLTLTGAVTSQTYFYQNSLSFEDYQVAPIEKVQIQSSEEDVGVIYPDLVENANTYRITGNLLLTTTTTEVLKPVAQVLYEQLSNVSYTPCKVSIPSNRSIRAGHTVQITDRNGKTITAYVMTKKQAGQKDTLECTGSVRRDSVSTVNHLTLRALSGKVLNLRLEIDGVKLENKDARENAAALGMTVEGIQAQVRSQEQDLQNQQEQITSMEQTAKQVQLRVQTLQQEGVDKVKTQTGYTFDSDGLHISKSDSDLANSVTEKGMYVVRGGDTVVLQADVNGVIARDVSVHNYLIIGDHARFENYKDVGENRTACFFLGG